ncbi:MAG: methyltransferase domain-containing protein [Bryobacterales bacterium]|nr:methyltransferase domain-containing protein [Bryobacterales bacterium]
MTRKQRLPNRFRSITLVPLLLTFASVLIAESRHPVSGRIIAPVMGVAGADWLVRPERIAEENPDLAIKLLNFQPGMQVADIGAGVGYYSLKIAKSIGPTGTVYATDLQPEMLRLLRKRLEKEKVTNVKPVLGSETASGLMPASIDLALMVDVYHEFAHPQAMLRSIAKALKTDGRLVLLEFRQEDLQIPIRKEHKMSVATVRQELEAEGYRFEKVIPDLPWQHILIFRRPAAD